MKIRFGICISTFDEKVCMRLDFLLNSIQRFSAGYDYKIYVRDDGTPNSEAVSKTEYVARKYGATFIRGDWAAGAGSFDYLGRVAIGGGCDVLIFISDDCLVSNNWLQPLQYFYSANRAHNIGMVSTPYIEAWELSMNGLIGYDDAFYTDWPQNDGTIMREDLTFTEELYNEMHEKGRCTIGSYEPMGPIIDGKFKLTHPVPLDGGTGPCFSIATEAFQEIDGFDMCLYSGNYEAMIGWKCWNKGYYCCLIPGPSIYHARGVATRSLIDLIPEEKRRQFKLWSPEAADRFHDDWGAPFDRYQKAMEQVLARNSEAIKSLAFIPYRNMEWPVNKTYADLTQVNQGPIHWKDEFQQKRMQWIASHCNGTVLDVGCATGGLLEFLPLTIAPYYTGVDLDRIRIDEAREKHPLATFYVMDATYGLPWPQMHFNTVVCADCLEHIPQGIAADLRDALANVAIERLLITLPISEKTVPNLDHMWEPNERSVRTFLEPLEEKWYIETTEMPDFVLIEAKRKTFVDAQEK